MPTNKQFEMIMRDMLFITWAVEPEAVRKVVDARLALDTKTGADGKEIAFVSAVCFHVTQVRSGALPLPSLSFQQVNYRAYVRAGEVPGICFLGMKVNSRMVTSLTSFLNVPVQYEDIDITTSPDGSGLLSYTVRSVGLHAEAIIDHNDVEKGLDDKVPPKFITDRLVGYAGSGNGMFRIDVEQTGLDSISARVRSVQAPGLERLGLLTRDQSAKPYSALYISAGSLGADAPVREW